MYVHYGQTDVTVRRTGKHKWWARMRGFNSVLTEQVPFLLPNWTAWKHWLLTRKAPTPHTGFILSWSTDWRLNEGCCGIYTSCPCQQPEPARCRCWCCEWYDKCLTASLTTLMSITWQLQISHLSLVQHWWNQTSEFCTELIVIILHVTVQYASVFARVTLC